MKPPVAVVCLVAASRILYIHGLEFLGVSSAESALHTEAHDVLSMVPPTQTPPSLPFGLHPCESSADCKSESHRNCYFKQPTDLKGFCTACFDDFQCSADDVCWHFECTRRAVPWKIISSSKHAKATKSALQWQGLIFSAAP